MAAELTVVPKAKQKKKSTQANLPLLPRNPQQSRSHRKPWLGPAKTEHQEDTAQGRQDQEKGLVFIERTQQ